MRMVLYAQRSALCRRRHAKDEDEAVTNQGRVERTGVCVASTKTYAKDEDEDEAATNQGRIRRTTVSLVSRA
jgi:hypothetical protein